MSSESSGVSGLLDSLSSNSGAGYVDENCNMDDREHNGPGQKSHISKKVKFRLGAKFLEVILSILAGLRDRGQNPR